MTEKTKTDEEPKVKEGDKGEKENKKKGKEPISTDAINTDTTSLPLPHPSGGGSLFAKIVAILAFIFACIAMIVSFKSTKRMTRQIASLDSEIWSLDRKIDDSMGSFDRSIMRLENKVTGMEDSMKRSMERSLVLAELRRVSMTVQDISRRASERVSEHASRVAENIETLIKELEGDNRESSSKEKIEPPIENPTSLSIPFKEHVKEHSSMGEVEGSGEKEIPPFGEIHIEPEKDRGEQP